MEDDNSLYNAMIWALIIGIIVVIATLYMTRPEPEKFTELYFNNHQDLPKYIDLDEKHNYEFTIHNLEHQEKEYAFTISTELYDFDLTCERPDLWLEGNTTRKTETDDPTLYIKEHTYAITFNYELINSEYLLFGLTDRYAVNITDDTLTFNNNKKIYQWKLNNTNQKHKFTIYIDKEFTRIVLDKQEFYAFTDYEYTDGYPYLETGYAEITGFQIMRRNAKQNVNIRVAESTYKEIPLVKELDKGVVILYSRFLSSPLYDKIVDQPIIRTIATNDTLTYYHTQDPVNITDYTLTASFRAGNSRIETGFEDELEIKYFKGILTINNVDLNVGVASSSDIKIVVNDNIDILFNDKKIMELNQTVAGKPYIKAYNNAVINDFTIKSNKAPVTIKYKIPGRQVVTYSGLFTISTISNILNQTKANDTLPDDDALSRVQDLYEREKINWANYRITASYIDTNKTNEFTISYSNIDQTIYSVSIMNNTALILIDGTLREIPVESYAINRVAIDVNGETMTIYLNDKQLIREKIPIKEGFILFEYSGINLLNAQAENKDTNTVKIYRKQANTECDPILIKKYEYTNTKSLGHDQSLVFNAYFNITEPFDIAKIKVSLDNGQEIHYWVRQK